MTLGFGTPRPTQLKFFRKAAIKALRDGLTRDQFCNQFKPEYRIMSGNAFDFAEAADGYDGTAI